MNAGISSNWRERAIPPASRAVVQVPRMQDRLWRDIGLPKEVEQVRSHVRSFADEVVAPVAHDLGQREEARAHFPFGVFDAMAAQGLFEIPFDRGDGGRGGPHRVTSTVVAIEELAYHSNSIAAIFDVHCILAGHALETASAALRRQFLGPLIAGQVVGSFATSEPDASTDLSPRALRTQARSAGGDLVLEGRKRFITNSPVADFVVVLCTVDGAPSLVVVPLDAPGVTVGEPDRKLGNRAQLTADVSFDHVRVDRDLLVGEPGHGLRYALQTLTYGRIGIAATGVGLAQAVFDQCCAHLQRREAFGRKLAQFQHWQFRMAEYAARIESARALYLKAAARMDAGESFPEPEAAMAKWIGTELAVDIARDGIQVFGGYGFMRELSADGSTYKVEEVYRDAKIGEIYEGTNEIQRLVTARQIFGKALAG